VKTVQDLAEGSEPSRPTTASGGILAPVFREEYHRDGSALLEEAIAGGVADLDDLDLDEDDDEAVEEIKAHARAEEGSGGGVPLYEQIADRIAEHIENGVLRPGDRVPSVRKTSRQHKVSVSTAVQAFITLENRGLIEARPKSGFYVKPRGWRILPEPRTMHIRPASTPVDVADILPRFIEAANNPSIVQLGAACPSPELMPVAKLSRILGSVARRFGAKGIAYCMPPGAESLRRQIAKRALDAGCQLLPEDLITTSGGIEALGLCLSAVTKPGDVVAVESPSYYGLLQLCQDQNLEVVEIPMHPRDGMVLDELAAALNRQKISAVLSVTNFSNPLGTCMPDENKRRLVEMLAAREIPLIEDDIYGDLHFGPQRPRVAKAFDRKGLVLYCSSFSKTLAPGYRVGWCAPGRFYREVEMRKFTHTGATATLPQLAIADFLENGGYDHHLRGIRKTYAEQVRLFSQAIAEQFPQGTKVSRPAGGFVLWVELPESVDAYPLHEEALQAGISIAPGPMFSARQEYRHHIRISCGFPWTPKMEQGIAQLGKIVRRMA
jgi:DNA-binding transcriptional MocR family regulator